MRRLVDLVKLNRLNHLIRRQATGTPEELAERLDISRSSLFEIISYLREEMQAPILYDKYIRSYVYEYLPKFHLGFERDRLSETEMYKAMAGRKEDDDIILDDDIDFNNLFPNE